MTRSVRLAGAAALALILAGCQTAATNPAPSGPVSAPDDTTPAAPGTLGAGDQWGWALYRADQLNAPRGEPVGEPVSP